MIQDQAIPEIHPRLLAHASSSDIRWPQDEGAIAATAALLRLVEMGMVREITGRKRSRRFAQESWLQVLGEGTEPKPR